MANLFNLNLLLPETLRDICYDLQSNVEILIDDVKWLNTELDLARANRDKAETNLYASKVENDSLKTKIEELSYTHRSDARHTQERARSYMLGIPRTPRYAIPMVNGGKKIEAIKAIRAKFGFSLKESKDFIEGKPLHLTPADHIIIDNLLNPFGYELQ